MTPAETRELLTLAAKAAGLHICGWSGGNPIVSAELPLQNIPFVWLPLTDDGDALQLAVKLEMVVFCPDKEDPTAVARGWDDSGQSLVEVENNDPYAATRLAIVRAAAEIGRLK